MTNNLTIFTDGGARGNPGPAACAFIVKDTAKDVIYSQGNFLGWATNNVAEYSGVLQALGWLLNCSYLSQLSEINFCLDSTLVVEQLKGNFKVKDVNLKKLYLDAQTKMANIIRFNPRTQFTFKYIPRVQNHLADTLVNQTLDSNRS
jgi:ribonuclease HI